MDAPIRLDVFADVACPWCLIGHRRLERALADEPAGSVEVQWRAFLLDPDIPAAGIPRREYYEAKFGAQAERLFERVRAEGTREGLALDFTAAERAVNTRLAHRAVKLCGDAGGRAFELLMSAYLEHGVDVGDLDAVVGLLGDHGLASDDLAARLRAGEGEEEVEHDLRLAAQIGLHAVPAFIADAALALSGAHEPPLLRKLLAAARERRPAAAA